MYLYLANNEEWWMQSHALYVRDSVLLALWKGGG